MENVTIKWFYIYVNIFKYNLSNKFIRYLGYFGNEAVLCIYLVFFFCILKQVYQ